VNSNTDIVPRALTGELVNPRTGEAVTPDSPDDVVIDFLEFLRLAGTELSMLDGEVSQWLRDRADARRKWTLAGGRVSMPSDRDEVTWNKLDLVTVLSTLEAEGAISAADLEEVAPLVREVHVAALNRLIDRSLPDVVERIRACQVHVPKRSRPVKIR